MHTTGPAAGVGGWGGVQIVRAFRGEDHAAWASALARADWLADSRVLKQDHSGWVRAATLLGRDVVIKCRTIDGAWARFKCSIGRGKGDRHWRGAAMLAGRSGGGVPTARVHVLARAMIDGRDCELLVMQRITGPTLLQVMADVHASTPGAPGIRRQHALARDIGTQIAQMAPLFNRDHKPSNLIISAAPPAPPAPAQIAIIDCEGVRRAFIPGAARMFASLVIEPTGCGVPPRRAIMLRALNGWLNASVAAEIAAKGRRSGILTRAEHRELLRQMWRDVARIIAQHGDPRPRVNPLAPAS